MVYTTTKTFSQEFEDIERIVERINSKVPNMISVKRNEDIVTITANNGKEVREIQANVYDAYSALSSLSHKVFND